MSGGQSEAIFYISCLYRIFFRCNAYIESSLDIILCRIYQASSECILGCFMHIVHAQLSEDILAVGVHGMETGESLFGYFLGGHTKGDVLQDFGLGLGKVHLLFRLLLHGSQQNLHHALADKAVACHAETDSLLNLHHRTLLKKNTKHAAASNEHLHEVGTQIFTEQKPSGIGKTLVEDEELGGIIDVEERVV